MVMVERVRRNFRRVVAATLPVLALWTTQCREADRERPHAVAPLRPESLPVPSPAASSAGTLVSAPETTASSEVPGPSPAPRGPVVVVAVAVLGGVRADALERVARIKPAFVGCYRGALDERRDAALLGRVRIRLSVGPSGSVIQVDIPQYDRSRPIEDPGAAGSPLPNPTNPRLGARVVPCMMARVRGLRFGASDDASTITIDVRFE